MEQPDSKKKTSIGDMAVGCVSFFLIMALFSGIAFFFLLGGVGGGNFFEQILSVAFHAEGIGFAAAIGILVLSSVLSRKAPSSKDEKVDFPEPNKPKSVPASILENIGLAFLFSFPFLLIASIYQDKDLFGAFFFVVAIAAVVISIFEFFLKHKSSSKKEEYTVDNNILDAQNQSKQNNGMSSKGMLLFQSLAGSLFIGIPILILSFALIPQKDGGTWMPNIIVSFTTAFFLLLAYNFSDAEGPSADRKKFLGDLILVFPLTLPCCLLSMFILGPQDVPFRIILLAALAFASLLLWLYNVRAAQKTQ